VQRREEPRRISQLRWPAASLRGTVLKRLTGPRQEGGPSGQSSPVATGHVAGRARPLPPPLDWRQCRAGQGRIGYDHFMSVPAIAGLKS